MHSLRRYLPHPDKIRGHRWLRWMGPALHHPRLWHLSRRGLALGMALGVFFGLLIPIAQIPVSAAAAVALRANLPAAVASTLVTNPLTFGPVYYAAWKLGSTLLGERTDRAAPAMPGAAPAPATSDPAQAAPAAPEKGWWATLKRRLLGVGKPLLLGLALIATAVGLFTYFVVSWFWAAKVWWTRRRRLSMRAARHT